MYNRFLKLFYSYFPKPIKKLLKQVLPDRIINKLSLSKIQYEPDVCHIIEKIVQPSWICADVGAHMGIITLLLAKLVGNSGFVYSFEAYPENAKRLLCNLRNSKYSKRIRVENVAVSDGSKDYIWLFPGRGKDSAEWNIMGQDVEGNRTEPEIIVPSISLDDYFPRGSQLDFVKIDVEGAEALVIRGMQRILSENRPILIIEFHYDDVWNIGSKQLVGLGYILYRINNRFIEPVIDLQGPYHCLALPDELIKNKNIIEKIISQ